MRAIALWAAGLALVASPVVHAQDIYDNSCPIRKELSTAQLTNKIARAIFQVQVKGADGVQRANGTATLIDARGYLLTAGHVIDGYASNGAGAIMLRRYDGLTFEAHIVENFLADGLDVAVLVVADFPKNAADPIPLRINSPGGPGAPGAPGSGVVLAYDNSGPAMRNPVKFTLGGYVADTSSMTLGFAAVGGNSGALLLEPSGRAFGLLRDGPDPVAMQMPLYVPETLIPGRNGKFALPEISIEILPEDLQATLLAAGKSRALPISSFWDRLAKAVPPSPQVAEVLNELRATGWRNVVASMDSDGGYHLSTTDLIHLFQAVGQDDRLSNRSLLEFGQAMNVISETCSEVAFRQFVLMRRLRPLAELASTSTDTSESGALTRAQASRVLASAVRAAASSPSETVEGRPLRELVSDLAVVEFNRAKLGEASADSAQQLVAIAEGLGGTPASGEMAALYASRAGDPSSGAAFFALADSRLKAASLTDSKQVIQRRETLARLFNKMDGRATFGTSLPQVNIADVQARLNDTSGKAPIVHSIANMTPDRAKSFAQTALAF